MACSGPGCWRAGGRFTEVALKLELLKQAAGILSKCGAPKLPNGLSCVPLEKKILLPMVLQPGQSTTFTKEIPGDTVFCLRAISSDQFSNSITGVRVQIQFPSGRFLFGGNGQDIGQFAGVGSYRFLIDPEMDFQPRGKIKVTLTDYNAGGMDAALPVNLVFEGVDKYYFKGQEMASGLKLASTLPKIRGDANQNILAPCWLTGAEPPVPKGYTTSDLFTYSSDVFTFTVGALTAGYLTIPIDEGYDFFCRRVLTDLQVTNSAAGVVLGRLRTGTGYAFCDDYMDMAKYICGSEWPKDWKIRGRDAIVADLQLADASGAGDVTYQIHLEGVRRRIK